MVIRFVGGTVLTETGLVEGDVWVDGATVASIGPTAGSADETFDVSGMLVGPGLVDVHTHLRDPGQTWKEDLRSGSRAAAAGGYTAIVAMPNTEPAVDEAGLVGALEERARDEAAVTVAFASALTRGRQGEELVDFRALYDSGVRMFTDDGDWLADPDLVEQALEQTRRLPGAVVAQHAEDTAYGQGHVHAGSIAEKLGVEGSPSEAETQAVTRDLRIAERLGARLHIQHVSCARTVAAVQEARSEGVEVTMEVTPHHLDFDVSELEGGDTRFKMFPPLRERSDRDALRAALRRGVIDLVATDHAPHLEVEKDVPFVDAPRGVIGLETAASVVWGLVEDPELFFEVASLNPARLIGLGRHGLALAPGRPANLVVFDPSRRWVPSRFVSKSSNSPYLGRELQGRVVHTVHEGRLVHSLAEVAR
jgi:dihydroorotase